MGKGSSSLGDRRCVVCGKVLDKKRLRRQTCGSDKCGEKAMLAWVRFLAAEKDRLMKEAVERFG